MVNILFHDVLNCCLTQKCSNYRYISLTDNGQSNQLRDLRAGKGNEADLTRVIQDYQNSAFYYDKAHAFLEQRKRVINTINLIMDEAKKNKAPGDVDVFVVAEARQAQDNACLINNQ